MTKYHFKPDPLDLNRAEVSPFLIFRMILFFSLLLSLALLPSGKIILNFALIFFFSSLLLWVSFRNAWAQWKIIPRLKLSTNVFHPGEILDFEIAINAKKITSLKKIQASFIGVETTLIHGRNQQWEQQNELFRFSKNYELNQILSPGDVRKITDSFSIPAKAPFFLQTREYQRFCTLEVRIVLKWWPDYFFSKRIFLVPQGYKPLLP